VARLGRKMVVSSAVRSNKRKATRRLYDASLVSSSAGGGVLGIAVWAQKPKVRLSVISVDTVAMIQDELQLLVVPYQWFGVKAANRVVASLWDRWCLTLSPG
jgi:hypothetical protein